MKDAHVPIIGAAGLLAQIKIEEANAYMGFLVGAATAAYMLSKVFLLWKKQKPNEKNDTTID